MKKAMLFILALSVSVSLFTVPVLSADTDFKVAVNNITEPTYKGEVPISIRIALPVFSGFSGADKLNSKISDRLNDYFNMANTSAMELDEFFKLEKENVNTLPSHLSVELISGFDYTYNGNILSVALITYMYQGGAHGGTFRDCFTFDTSNGVPLTLASFFAEGADYKETLADKILTEMTKDSDRYFPEAADTVLNYEGDYSFFINGQNLEIYFGEYEIAPYAAGEQVFSFRLSNLYGVSPDMFNALSNSNPLGGILFNGATLQTDLKPYYDESEYVMMVPLRLIAENLGYVVDWSREKGIGVDKKPLPEDLYVQITDGVAYVPIGYFTDALRENVMYYMGVLRVFKQ